MSGCKELLLLGLGLCMVCYHVSAVGGPEVIPVAQIQSNNHFQQQGNDAYQLDRLNKMKINLERNLKFAWNVPDKIRIQGDLKKVNNAIDSIEKKSQVSYKDHLQMQENQKAQYEREIEELKKKLEKAHDVDKANQFFLHKKSYDILAAEKKKIEQDFAKYAQASKLNAKKLKEGQDTLKLEKEEVIKTLKEENEKDIKTLKQEKEEVIKTLKQEKEEDIKTLKQEKEEVIKTLKQEQEEVIKTLETAKEKHARAINAITANSYAGYKPVRLPQQAKINELKNDLKEFVTMKDKKKQNEGLLLTKTKLTSLLPILYEHSKFYPETDRKDMEDALSVMEMNTVLVRDEQNRQRKELVQKMEGKDLTELSDDEIESLRKINEEIAVTDMIQQEVGTRSAYLKGLLEVDDLINECSDAIKASEQGKIAKFLANAIAEAKQGNLAKLWTGAA